MSSITIPAVTQSFMQNPLPDGTVLVGSSVGLEVGAYVFVSATGQPTKLGTIKSITGNSVKLQLPNGNYFDASAYSLLAGGYLTMPAQAVSAIGSATDPFLTDSAATGLTTNSNQAPVRITWKATIAKAAWGVAASANADVDLCTVPAKARVVSVIADTTVAFTGLAGTIQVRIGKTAGGQEYLLAHDVKSAPVTKGLADADMGASLTAAAAVQNGDIPSWSAATVLKARLVSGTGNVGNGTVSSITNGTVVVYITVELMP